MINKIWVEYKVAMASTLIYELKFGLIKNWAINKLRYKHITNFWIWEWEALILWVSYFEIICLWFLDFVAHLSCANLDLSTTSKKLYRPLLKSWKWQNVYDTFYQKLYLKEMYVISHHDFSKDVLGKSCEWTTILYHKMSYNFVP